MGLYANCTFMSWESLLYQGNRKSALPVHEEIMLVEIMQTTPIAMLFKLLLRGSQVIIKLSLK